MPVVNDAVIPGTEWPCSDVFDIIRGNFLTHASKVAVNDDAIVLSYALLGRRVAEIAAILAKSGVGRGDYVAIAVAHTVDLVSSALAVMARGAAFVPIDTRNPPERVKFIISDSACKVVLHSRRFAGHVSELQAELVCVDDIAAPQLSEEIFDGVRTEQSDPAYILYTSGSTGRPKGVCVTRANLNNYVFWASDRYIRSSTDCVALYSTLAFDFTITCLFPPLMKGASIRVYDGISDPFIIKKIANDDAVSVIKMTPSYLAVLAEFLPRRSRIHTIIVGGEDLKVALAKRIAIGFQEEVEIINEYGPTEATVGCMHHRFDPETDTGGSVPLGLPISNTEIYLLDSHQRPVRNGEIGEMFIAGASVACGYLNRPDLTNAYFSHGPAGSRVYRSGDLAREDEGGSLFYFGRKDNQLKIRGYRVHSSEVEAALLRSAYVKDAYVTHVERSTTNELVAAVSLHDPTMLDDLRSEIAKALPDYMVPAVLIALDPMPMTSNQKVDRSAVLSIAEGRNRDE